MKIELDADNIRMLVLALEELTIKGKDAPVLGNMIVKLSGHLEKQVEIDNKKIGDG
jgi:hypothetical protein